MRSLRIPWCRGCRSIPDGRIAMDAASGLAAGVSGKRHDKIDLNDQVLAEKDFSPLEADNRGA